MIGENPQLELRPAPESVGRLHERGLVDSLLFTTKPAIPRVNLVAEEARPSICLRMRAPSRLVRRSPKGEGGRTGRGRECCKRPMVRDASLRDAPHHEVFERMRGRPCKSPAFRLYYQEIRLLRPSRSLFFSACMPCYRAARAAFTGITGTRRGDGSARRNRHPPGWLHMKEPICLVHSGPSVG